MRHIDESIIGRRGTSSAKQDNFSKIFADKNNIYVIVPHAMSDIELFDDAIRSLSNTHVIKQCELNNGNGALIFTGPGRDFLKLKLKANYIICDIYWTPNGYNETISKFISRHNIKYPHEFLEYPDDFSLIHTGTLAI